MEPSLSAHKKHQEHLHCRKQLVHQENHDFNPLVVAHTISVPISYMIIFINGAIIGQRMMWHRKVHEARKTWLEFKIQEYKKCQQQWIWTIDNIERKLNLMFNFTPIPTKRAVLEKYVYKFISNDKQKWKTY